MAEETGGAKPEQETTVDQRRSKKKRGGKGAAQEVAVPSEQQELVRIIRCDKKTDEEADSTEVLLSKTGKAPQLALSEDRLSVSGTKGYRTVRATHGVHSGTWYMEFFLKHLGTTGHARLGWCTKKAELQAPVGFDEHGFGFRDLEGSKVHLGRREPYGISAFKEGDTVGMLIHLPEGGRPIEVRERKVVRFKGSYYYEDEPEPKPLPLLGSQIAFSVNGLSQGRAFSDINEGTYYPAVSLFTLPEQTEGATVVARFGPPFAFPPLQLEGLPAAQPLSACIVAAGLVAPEPALPSFADAAMEETTPEPQAL